MEDASGRCPKVPDDGAIGPEPGEGRRQVFGGAHESVAPLARREKRKLGGVSLRQSRRVPPIVMELTPIVVLTIGFINPRRS